MTVEVLAEGSCYELVIDLSVCNTLEEMKGQLEKSLAVVERYGDMPQICIDTGVKRLTEKQLRELEYIVDLHGLELTRLRNSEKGRNSENEEPPPLAIPGFNSQELMDSSETAMISRHIRSGQKFFARRNIVVMGDVNPGAEVIAGGNILVMGALRGMAHAGAWGDEQSVIAAFRMNPTQLRIATHITRSPEEERFQSGIPEVARIRDGKVIIEKFKI